MLRLYEAVSPAALGTSPAEAKNPGEHQNDKMNHCTKNSGKEKITFTTNKEQSKWGKSEKDKYQCHHSRGIWKNDTKKLMHKTETQISKSNLQITKGETRQEGWIRKLGWTHTRSYIWNQWSKRAQGTGHCTQHSVMTYMRNESVKGWIHVYGQQNHFALGMKLQYNTVNGL